MTAVVFADIVGSTSLFEMLGDQAASRFVTELMSSLRQIFELHQGRVVKLLGDGLFVLFYSLDDALAACVDVQKNLSGRVIQAGEKVVPVQMQMGIASGDVVEIEGDCFGDAVNSAARLADLAGASQILTTENVWHSLPLERQTELRCIGQFYLRGRANASFLYRVEWQTEHVEDATMVGRSVQVQPIHETLRLASGERIVTLKPNGGKVLIGRASGSALQLDDLRVSRLHAMLEWRGTHFVLTDTSSYGTWVYLGKQGTPVRLRRTECQLVGVGEIVLGCERGDENAPIVTFSIQT